MAVYIDKANIKYKRMIMCHMIADSYEELHYMAKKIGMKSAWFQNNASFPHYDVCLMRKKKALELPGLWNGAMAYWNTIFVEVPLITFNPVKTVNDLLKSAHQIT